MKNAYPLLIVVVATVLLLHPEWATGFVDLPVHPHAFVNGLALYQCYALTVALLIAGVVTILSPSSRQFLSIGQVKAIAHQEKWLGINGRSTWLSNALQLLLFISIPTAVFMSLGVYYTGSLQGFQEGFIPWIILFSLTNSLAEELIFRFVLVGGLVDRYSSRTVLLCSAVLFGLPHYWGYPSGVVGVLMSGLLGYVLCKATIETKGLSIAWLIHFVQDLIIFTALFMMNVK
jgi:uncharacterized protein